MATATLERSDEKNAFGDDKVARYGWRVASKKGEFRELNKRLLKVNNAAYQRDAFKAKTLELASNWSWLACGVLIVARRDGVLWVIDGQHRKLAADKRSDITELPCMVFDVEDVKAEAKGFLATNTNRKPVTALGKFKALLTSEDPAAILVDDVVQSCGLRFATASKEAGDFKAVSWALAAAEKDRDAFVLIMQTAADLCLAEKSPLHHQIVKGLQYIHENTAEGLGEARLAKRIRQIGLTALYRGAVAAGEYYAGGGARVYASGMMQAINKGLQNKFELGQAQP